MVLMVTHIRCERTAAIIPILVATRLLESERAHIHMHVHVHVHARVQNACTLIHAWSGVLTVEKVEDGSSKICRFARNPLTAN